MKKEEMEKSNKHKFVTNNTNFKKNKYRELNKKFRKGQISIKEFEKEWDKVEEKRMNLFKCENKEQVKTELKLRKQREIEEIIKGKDG